MATEDKKCSCEICCQVRIRIEQIFQVLKIYGWLLDSYVVDFFEKTLWSKLPLRWQEFLEQTTPKELGLWILRESDPNSKNVWPLSMLALRRVIDNLQIDRNHEKNTVFQCQRNLNGAEFVNSGKIESRENGEKFNNLFLKHVKVKKRYEVEKLAKILSDISAKTNCRSIIDVGSGIGHLSRMMAFKYDSKISRIEQDEILLNRARNLDEELLLTIRKHIPDFTRNLPQHFAVKLDPCNVEEKFLNDASIDDFGVIGLHACGDLATTLIRFFSNCNKTKFICVVGCCYMKLTTSETFDPRKCYPLSDYVSSLEQNAFSYNALEVACHAVEKHCEKLKKENLNDQKVHAYRAALECVIVNKNPKNRHSQVRNVKVKNNMSFQQYCELAIQDIDIHNLLGTSDFENPEILELVKQWKRVVLFGTLRLMLAPLVETVVLLDRFLYLSEHEFEPYLKAEFDAKISPRNFVLLCTKNK